VNAREGEEIVSSGGARSPTLGRRLQAPYSGKRRRGPSTVSKKEAIELMRVVSRGREK